MPALAEILTIKTAMDLIQLGLRLYAELSGPPIDLTKLAKDSGVEILRIDEQQAKDEAAENKLAGG
jgi:hypothetical protein